ncbi:MAG: hydrophobic/amphiphilic exporter-1 (mainly G- bacteria) HAE1 family [Puniceicoccaceae bacterium 5H]|nr:MAG: hydrophobic/amphiphilic exporter-1 (mainly G- bacteria) HAE1 family [Puniceicoccaceae bacterium 5H]
MSLPKFSVRRPVFVTMITLIVVVLGIVSLRELKIDMLPSVELPRVSVRTSFPGASPEVMERMVTQIIEEIVATTPGIEELTSSSSEGDSRVSLTYGFGTDVDQAALDLQATLADEINELPDDIVRPRVSKFDIDSFPVVLLGISSKLDPVELTEVVENQLRYRFTRIPGVAQADLWGGFTREIRVEIDPDRMRSLGLSIDTVLDAIEDANLDLPAGKIESGRYEVTLRAPADYQSLDEIRNTVIMNREGAPIRLGQVGEIKDTYTKLTRYVRINDEQGLRIAIRKKAGANTVEVSRAILDEIDEINASFPQLEVVPVINQGNFIQRSIENVARSVLYGGGLAILILLFFLRNLRSTVIIGVAIPISIIATFSLIYFLGFTINLMTLGGLALGVGMMVDSSIVVLENIFRRRDEEGEDRREASAHGADEVASAITASTITTLVIFLPIIFVQGVSGVLFRDLAYVIVFSLCCSLAVALSLVPMLCSRFLRSREQEKNQPTWVQDMLAWSDRGFKGLENAYSSALDRVLAHRFRTIGLAALLLGGSLMLWPLIGSEFLPPTDEGEVRVEGEMEVGTRLELVNDQTRLMENIVFGAVPEMVSSVVSVSGNEGEIRLSLTPAAERERSNIDIAEDLRQRLEGQIPGMEVRTRAPQGQFLLDRLLGGGGEGLTVEIRGFEFDTLGRLGREVEAAVQDIEGVTDVRRSITEGIPQEEIQINREKIADLGLSARDVTRLVETAIAGSDAGEYQTGGNSYRIFVQLADAEQRTIDEVLDLRLQTPDGEEVALRNLVDVTSGRGPQEITRKDQQRIARVDLNISGRDQGSVAADVEQALSTIPLPSGYAFNVAGSYEEQQEASRELGIAFLLAILLVYMVLACQYESLRNPLVVMFSVPTAAIGVLLTLFLTGTTLNLQSGIGCIMLAGIVVNNAILLVDQAGQLEAGGWKLGEAVREAGRRRLRPILMTSLTTVLGLLPLALGIGEGADAQAPLGRAVVGGLFGSTLITLFLVPAIYSLMHSGNRKEAA